MAVTSWSVALRTTPALNTSRAARPAVLLLATLSSATLSLTKMRPVKALTRLASCAFHAFVPVGATGRIGSGRGKQVTAEEDDVAAVPHGRTDLGKSAARVETYIAGLLACHNVHAGCSRSRCARGKC